MDKIAKTLQRLTQKERAHIKEALDLISTGQANTLDVKKLKGRNDVFRIRKGNIRLIYRLNENKQIFILTIERRNENAYKF